MYFLRVNQSFLKICLIILALRNGDQYSINIIYQNVFETSPFQVNHTTDFTQHNTTFAIGFRSCDIHFKNEKYNNLDH